jgi:hypothetical protein
MSSITSTADTLDAHHSAVAYTLVAYTLVSLTRASDMREATS